MVAVSLVGLCVWFTLGVLGSKRRSVFGSPFRLVAVVLAVLVGLVAGCSADQGEAFDVAVAATVEAVQAEVPTVEPAVVEPTVVPTLEPVPTVSVTYDGVYAIELDGSGDYATIEEALEQVTNGAELRLGAGTFLVTAPLVIDKDIVLTGAGQNSTTIAMGGTNDLIISVTEAEVTITDLTTDGGFGVNVNESEIDIQRVTFQRSSLDGLTISNSVGTVTDSISQDNSAGFWWAGLTGRGKRRVWHQTTPPKTTGPRLRTSARHRRHGADRQHRPSNATACLVATSGCAPNTGMASRLASRELTGNTSKDNGGSGFVWFGTSVGCGVKQHRPKQPDPRLRHQRQRCPGADRKHVQRQRVQRLLVHGQRRSGPDSNTSKDNAQAGFAGWGSVGCGVKQHRPKQSVKRFPHQR